MKAFYRNIILSFIEDKVQRSARLYGLIRTTLPLLLSRSAPQSSTAIMWYPNMVSIKISFFHSDSMGTSVLGVIDILRPTRFYSNHRDPFLAYVGAFPPSLLGEHPPSIRG